MISRSTAGVKKAKPVEAARFRPMEKELAEFIADRITQLTGEPCRIVPLYRYLYSIERYTGGRWIKT